MKFRQFFYEYVIVLVAAFYAECPSKHIQIDGCLWTKSKFLGLSVAVHMIGDATLTLLDHDERYVMTFPSAYGRYDNPKSFSNLVFIIRLE